jgi:hypothetical protein
MPLYTYDVCVSCGECSHDRVVKIADRDQQSCGECGEKLAREEVSVVASILFENYQTKAIMSDGTKVAGHFGRAAPKRKPIRSFR